MGLEGGGGLDRGLQRRMAKGNGLCWFAPGVGPSQLGWRGHMAALLKLVTGTPLGSLSSQGHRRP